MVLVNAMHITASVFINDDEPGCTRIMRSGWRSWPPRAGVPLPPQPDGGDNGDAHLKRQVMGRECLVAVTAGSWISAPGSRSSTESSTAQRKAGLVKIIGE
jgi:thiamine phosphate synthase YjbQ (UPF0047 family)